MRARSIGLVLFLAAAGGSYAADSSPLAWRILGPLDLTGDDALATSSLGAFLAREADAMESGGSTLWRHGEPFRWIPVREDSDGAIWIRHQFGAARQSGDAAYLFARIGSWAPVDKVVEIAHAGAVELWLNGTRVAPSAEYRGPDRSVWRVRLGTSNTLAIECRAPERIAPWRVEIRVADPSDLSAPSSRTPSVALPANEESDRPDASDGSRETTPSSATDELREGGRPWLVRLPPDWTDSEKRAPLVVVLPRLDETPDDAMSRRADLIAEVGRRGWIVLVPDVLATNSSFHRRLRPVEIARLEVMETMPVDPARVYLVAEGDAAETGLALALMGGEDYAAAGFVEGRWASLIPWETLLLGRLPRPALFLASSDRGAADALRGLDLRLDDKDGAWRRRALDPKSPRRTFEEMLDFFWEHPLVEDPVRVAASNRASACERSRWIFLREAQNPQETATLSAERVSSSSTVLYPENVAQLDLSLRDMPGLNRARTVVLRIARQRLQIFPRVPDAVRCSLVVRDDDHSHWQAESIPVDSVAEPGKRETVVLSQSKKALPVWPTSSSAGVAGLLARAARQATGARVALVPNDGVFSGQDAGEIHLDDLDSWCFDARLSTASVAVADLVRALGEDYAGARLLAADGIDVVAAAREPAEDADSPDASNTSGTLRGAVSSAWTDQGEIVSGGVLQTSSFDDSKSEVVVVSWRNLLERAPDLFGLDLRTSDETLASATLRAREAGPSETSPPPTIGTRIHDTVYTQRTALLKLLDAEPELASPKPSIRGLAAKEPVAMKKWVNRPR
ncbi:hypothetical protein JW916_07125 [Candidatus Sumerlaeota bacterium]|nr:hypothetical protein [Candidatus Sumerlaeota bacterium]